MKVSGRAQRIEPFYVMEVAKAASALAHTVAHTDSPMVFLNIGEPDFTAPALVQVAACKAVHDGLTHYTPATGLGALRERISDWYAQRFGVKVASSRIVVTAGASAALQLACLALIESGDEILMPDPSYPCNRHFVSAADGNAVLIPATALERLTRWKQLGVTQPEGCCWHRPPTQPVPPLPRTNCAASTTKSAGAVASHSLMKSTWA